MHILFALLGLLFKSSIPPTNTNKLLTKANEAYDYCVANNMDTTTCFLIDMTIPSGLPRFYVWDFAQNAVVDSSQVCHGKKSPINGTDKLQFSNVKFSNCSSLGKYKVLERGSSKYGVGFNYILEGLEKTNSNARRRTVVLHSKDDVSDVPIYPKKLVMSSGCPSVSNNFMYRLDIILKEKQQPVLLWIFYNN
jgi:L,D-transpeptidase catalytic domain